MNDISIVIPYFNRAGALKRALASIARQTIRPKEVIVVDDGSTEPVPSGLAGIRIIRQENKGAPAARNRGLSEATGTFVIFWDADVIGEPEFLERLHDALIAHPEASFAYSNFSFGAKKMPAQAFNKDALSRCNYISSMALIRRTDAIVWDESLKRFQDWDYWLTMTEHGKIGVWVDAYLYKVETGGTMSSWLPSFVYKKPWRYLPWIRPRATAYLRAQAVIAKKHAL